MSRLPGLEVFLAGGSVRNIALEAYRDPRDFDFFLGGDGVQEALSLLEGSGELQTGPFGSPRWHPAVESDIYADIIPITFFYNGLWQCIDMVDALNQFDFTGNAVAVNLRTSAVLDPQNGIRDLQSRVMRGVRFDYPDEPISQHCLLSRPVVLWFRLLHYAVLLDLTIEPVTLRWLRAHRDYAQHIQAYQDVFEDVHPLYLETIDD